MVMIPPLNLLYTQTRSESEGEVPVIKTPSSLRNSGGQVPEDSDCGVDA